MRLMLSVAIPALILLYCAGSAPARTAVHARVKCVGLYCAIVTEPEPHPAPRPATRRRGWSKSAAEPACLPAVPQRAMRR